VYDELALIIEDQLKELISHSCFDIDVVEVDVRDNIALIFIDGEDAALLIGKEGYRYNALSYMLFNWLHAKYELFIKLEIAEFLTTQQEMIRNYIKPVIENVEKNGKGKTRFLDGILVQIALEQLRERFPDKYVAVKTGREGKKFVVINEFNNNKNNA
jgi:spoIIIJ-associated protein